MALELVNPPTCRHCKIVMVQGEALRNTLVVFPDFLGEPPGRGCTCSEVGPGKMTECWKCPSCGHSVTAAPGDFTK